jgi:nucleotide-binding universal stress UspA family protein
MRRILVALDGSPLAETILPFVEGLAAKTGARVTLLHVTPVPKEAPALNDYPSLDQMVQRASALAEEYLREHQRRLSSAGVEASVTVVAGRPAVEIVRHAAANDEIDVLALATHGRSGIGRWAYGSVADQVLHTTPKPLLLIRPDGWAAVPRTVQRIVVPLDGSPEAETVFQLAEPLAVQCGLPLVLLRFVEPLLPTFAPEMGAAAYMDLQAIIDGTIAESRRYLDEATVTLRARSVIASGEVSVAHPADGIADYSRQHPGSLVVLATHGRSGWQKLVLGSVARRVVQMVHGAILICPPPRATTLD